MTAFEVVTIAVSVIAVALCFTAYFRIKNVMSELLDRREPPPITDQPSEDERDQKISGRPLRRMPE